MAFVFDQEISIRLKDLRLLGLLNESSNSKWVTVKIGRKNALYEKTGVFNIELDTQVGGSCLVINFFIDGNLINQRFELIKKINNPPKGYKYYIICPFTGNNCTILYLDGESFKSCKAIKNGTYEMRTIKFGHKRSFFMKIKNSSKAEKLIAKMEKPNAKRYYKGMLTENNKRALMAKQTLKRIAATL